MAHDRAASAAAGPAAATAAEGVRCDRTVAWRALAGHFEAHGRGFDLRDAFARDPRRFDDFAVAAPEVFGDLSKGLWDRPARRWLGELARECGVEARRDALLGGAPVNATEGRQVLHTALRAPRGTSAEADEAADGLERMLAFADGLRAAAAEGRPGAIRDVVNIGIGGSDLGPRMAAIALADFAHPALRVHFVANVDPHDLDRTLCRLDAATTLFVIASKTFTTQETMANARAARRWFLDRGGREADLARHFVGVTTNLDAARDFGIATTFGFRDWVGGRFSLWSTIGLPLAIAIGAQGFRALLAGAHAMDRHFAEAPVDANLPLQLALLDVWHRDFHGFASRSVAPYAQALERLPAYLQQLEMESNGKRVDADGEPLPYPTVPVVWGEPGTNGQHAYFQMLHQGTDVVPVEFVLVREPAAGTDADGRERHAMLLANGLAQSAALMLGKDADAARAERVPTASPAFDRDALARHRTFPGNRPSTTLVLDALTPRSLGALVALHEHRVATAGFLWGVNSFDQWGVELGKAMAGQLLPRLASGDADGLDGSTAGLLRRLRRAG